MNSSKNPVRPGLSRRAVMMASLPAAMAWGGRAQARQDAPPWRFRAILVDASGVAEFGGARVAATLQRQLDRAAREVFADRLAPGDKRAPQLVLRLNSIKLASYVGGSPALGGDSSSKDFLDGAGLVVSGGRVLSTTPMLAVLDASYSGTWTLPDIDERRVASISHQFAYWLRRDMGL